MDQLPPPGAGPARWLTADYIDGRTAHAHRVLIWLEDGMLQLSGRDVMRQIPLQQVCWAGPDRSARLDDGSLLRALDVSAWDLWTTWHHLGEPNAAPPRQHWGWRKAATCLLVLVAVAGFGGGGQAHAAAEAFCPQAAQAAAR